MVADQSFPLEFSIVEKEPVYLNTPEKYDELEYEIIYDENGHIRDIMFKEEGDVTLASSLYDPVTECFAQVALAIPVEVVCTLLCWLFFILVSFIVIQIVTEYIFTDSSTGSTDYASTVTYPLGDDRISLGKTRSGRLVGINILGTEYVCDKSWEKFEENTEDKEVSIYYFTYVYDIGYGRGSHAFIFPTPIPYILATEILHLKDNPNGRMSTFTLIQLDAKLAAEPNSIFELPHMAKPTDSGAMMPHYHAEGHLPGHSFFIPFS